MTLFGQSAGGASTELYAYAWTKDPIISSFIVESGGGGSVTLAPGTSSSSNVSSINVTSPWYTISNQLGCGGIEAGEKTLKCMHGKSWKEIVSVLPKRSVLPDTTTGAFSPFADGKVVFNDVAKRRKEGNFIKAVRFPYNPSSYLSICIILTNKPPKTASSSRKHKQRSRSIQLPIPTTRQSITRNNTSQDIKSARLRTQRDSKCPTEPRHPSVAIHIRWKVP